MPSVAGSFRERLSSCVVVSRSVRPTPCFMGASSAMGSGQSAFSVGTVLFRMIPNSRRSCQLQLAKNGVGWVEEASRASILGHS